MSDIKTNDVWIKAQGYEVRWWKRHIESEIRPPSRDYMAGLICQSFRGHVNNYGLMKGNIMDRTRFVPPIMDLGSGIISMFENTGIKTVAVEPYLESMQGIFPELTIIGKYRNVDYVCGVVQDMPPNHFNTLWCCNMLDHTPDWHEIATVEFPRILTNNGTLFLSVDVRTGEHKTDAGHMGIFSAERIMEIISENFDIEFHSPLHSLDFYRLYLIGKKK